MPKPILNKPDHLTESEFSYIRRHPQSAYDMLRTSGEGDERILRGVREHHERGDAGGYPDGLPAGSICLHAKVTAVSDVYDAMVARRPFRDRSSPFDILAAFAASRLHGLDPQTVNVFLVNLPCELMDKRVILSDGRIARVTHIDPADFAYPMVSIGRKLIQTDHDLKCVAMDGFLSLLN